MINQAINDFQCINTLKANSAAIKVIAFAPLRQTIITGSEDAKINLWDLETGRLKYTLTEHSDSIEHLWVTPDNKILVSASKSIISGLNIKVWDLNTGKLLHSLPSNSEINCATITSDGEKILTGDADKQIQIWALKTGKLLTTLTGHSGAIASLIVTPDGKHIISGDNAWDAQIKVWSMPHLAPPVKETQKSDVEAVFQPLAAPTAQIQDSKIDVIVKRLREQYPNATYELNWETPEQMLVATILAAQCTDVKVNQVTEVLFKKYKTPEDIAKADSATLEEILKPTGFYQQKTRTIQTVCQTLVERFQGKVPQSMEALISIPGIARKTANVVLNCCYNIASGIIVDTHVARVSQRLGFSQQEKPEKIEQDLMKLVPQDVWTFWGPAFVLHGRYVCKAKDPDCHSCIFLDICPSAKNFK